MLQIQNKKNIKFIIAAPSLFVYLVIGSYLEFVNWSFEFLFYRRSLLYRFLRNKDHRFPAVIGSGKEHALGLYTH